MTRSGGNYNEMSKKNHTVDEGLEAMITGSPDPDHPLGRMFSDLRESATGWPTTDKAADHISAAVQEARLNVSAQASPAVMPTRRRVSRRRTVFSYLATSLIGKILVGSMAFAATGGTLAVTGSLPDPVQAAVASTVEVVGIHIPDPSDAEEVVVIDEAPEADEAAVVNEADDAVELEDADQAELEDADQAELEDADQAELEDADQAELEDADQAELEDADQAELEDADQAELEDADQAELEDADQAELEDATDATDLENAGDATVTEESDAADQADAAGEVAEAPETDEATG